MAEYKYVYIVYEKRSSNIYAWTHDKNILKCFCAQRDMSKYKVVKELYYDVLSYCQDEECIIYRDDMLSIIKFKSNKTNESYSIFSTQNELIELENRMVRGIVDKCEIGDMYSDDIEGMVSILIHMIPLYSDALYNIGYRPSAVSDIGMGDIVGKDDYESIINDAYVNNYMYDANNNIEFQGVNMINEDYLKFIYSIELFIIITNEADHLFNFDWGGVR